MVKNEATADCLFTMEGRSSPSTSVGHSSLAASGELLLSHAGSFSCSYFNMPAHILERVSVGFSKLVMFTFDKRQWCHALCHVSYLYPREPQSGSLSTVTVHKNMVWCTSINKNKCNCASDFYFFFQTLISNKQRIFLSLNSLDSTSEVNMN